MNTFRFPTLALLASLLFGNPLGVNAAPPKGERMLLFIGSNTLGEHAVPGLARAYLEHVKQAKNLDVLHQGEIIYVSGTLPDGQDVYVEVHATGSGDCFASFLGKYKGTYDQCDIGMSSRRIKTEEIEEIEARTGDMLARRGDGPGLGCEHPVAMDGLAIIGHESNPLTRISFQELQAIYSKKVTDWKELKEWAKAGGAAAGLPIMPLRRREPSGTLDVFVQNIKPEAGPMRDIAAFAGNDEVAASLAAQPGGVGFIGQSYPLAVGVKRLQVYNDTPESGGMTAEQAVFPDPSAVQSGAYPLSRIVYFYTSSVHLNPEIKPFVEFALSAEGQSVLATEGGLIKIDGTRHQIPRPRTTEEVRADVIAAAKSDKRKSKVILRLHGSNTVGAKAAVYLAINFLMDKRTKARANAQIDDLTTEMESPEGEKALAHDVMCDTDGDGVWETIEIRPTGSSDAFRSMLNGWCDVGMSSRRISEAEVRDLTEICGDLSRPGAQFALGLDALAIIANPANKVDEITLDQTARVFLGSIPDWSKLGGDAGPIHVHSRPERSGTYRSFCDALLQGRSILGDAKRHAENSAVAAAVVGDPAGIGFVPVSAVGAAKALSIGQDKNSPFVQPTQEAVRSVHYPVPLCRYVYFYVPEEKPEALTTEALKNWETAREFALSSQTWRGQAIVAMCGFVPEIALADVDGVLSPQSGETPMAYLQRLADLDRKLKLGKITLKPRLPENKEICARLLFDDRTKQPTAETTNTLKLKLGSWAKLYPRTSAGGLVAEGWTDDLANDPDSLAVSTERAQSISALITASLDVPVTAIGKGKSVNPPNNSEENKHMNRRVVLKTR